MVQLIIGRRLTMSIQQWSKKYFIIMEKQEHSQPVTFPLTRTYKASEISPFPRKKRFRASHNNRRMTPGRGFRWQLITIRSKKTGLITGYKSIYHEN
jgi:hypothetical protein